MAAEAEEPGSLGTAKTGLAAGADPGDEDEADARALRAVVPSSYGMSSGTRADDQHARGG